MWKLSAKSNKTSFNYLEFVIDTSLKCLSKHREPLSPIATEKPEHNTKQRFDPRNPELSPDNLPRSRLVSSRNALLGEALRDETKNFFEGD